MANPFKPTAGKIPPVLIGRQDILDDFAEALDNGAGAPGRLMLITGQRGFGKTVMLSEIRALARERGWFVAADNASIGMCDRLVRAIQPHGVKLRGMSIEPSIGIPGGLNAGFGGMTLETPVPDAVSLRSAINERLKKLPEGKGVLIAIDETQGVSMGDIVALATTFQHILADQDMLDIPDDKKKGIAFVFAALPSLMDDVLNNQVITFLRRAVRHMLAEVPIIDTRDAYIDVVAASGMHIEADVALAAARAAEGHPYMVQLIGYHMWRSAYRRGPNVIEMTDVDAGVCDAKLAFYEAICAPVYYGLRSPQRLFIEQMAKDEQDVSRMADVMERADRTESWAQKYRASLIRERVIEPAGHGLVRFLIPRLGAYIRDEIFWHEREDSFA